MSQYEPRHALYEFGPFTEDADIATEAHRAYSEAVIQGFTEDLQMIACKSPFSACVFASNIDGANITYCQEAACKDPKEAYWFAQEVKSADIEYCKKHMGEYLEQYLRHEMRDALR